MAKKLTRRELLQGLALAGSVGILAACQPQIVEVEKVIKETVVVEKIVKEVVKETIMVAGTPKVVEREITKIVKEELVVTATPAPPEEIEMVLTCAWGGAYGEMNTQFGDLYMERNPHVKLEVLAGQNDAMVITMIAGGDPPDVTHQYYCNMAKLGYQDGLTPVQPFIDTSEAAAYENFEEFDWDMARYAGQIYALPYLDSGCRCAVTYNGSLFEEAGLDPDAPPKTMAEFLDVCLKTTTFDDAGNIDVLAYNPRSGAEGLTMWHQALDVPYYDPIRRTFKVNQEAFVDNWKWMKGYYDAIGGFEKAAGWATANAGWLAGIFSEKQVFHVGGGQWIVGDIRANAPDVLPKMRHGWIPSDKGLKCIKTDGHQISIPRDVQDPEASWDLLEFYAASETVAETGWKLRGTFYPWKPWRDKQDFSGDAQFQWFVDTLKPGVADRMESYWPLDVCAYIAQEAGARETSAFEATMLGQMEIEEALQRVEDELNELMYQAIKEYG